MNKKGFTLIELLAVIIILGILMIIAIPAVTRYINDSRKSAYVDTAKEIIGSARNMVNDNLKIFDTDTTYYIDSACITTENDLKSPYGEFEKAYVIVTYSGTNYDYYWTSIDETGTGVPKITRLDKLNEDSIKSDLKVEDIPKKLGIDGRSKYMIIDKSTNCSKGNSLTALGIVDKDTGEELQIIEGASYYAEWDGGGTLYFGTIARLVANPTEINLDDYNVRYLWLYSPDNIEYTVAGDNNEEWIHYNSYHDRVIHVEIQHDNYLYHWKLNIIVLGEK